MSIKNLLLLNEEIVKCDERKDKNCRCKGSRDATPMVDTPEKTQSFMLITRDPSNNANNAKILVGKENSFFVNNIIPLLYNNYDIKKAKKSKHYFAIFQKHFHENVYWTHYAKCFPGINANVKKGHKTPNAYCANQFLLKEIVELNPKHLILIGDDTITFLTGEKTKDLIDNIVVRTLTVHEKEYNYLISTHPSEANAYKSGYKFNDTKIKIQSTYEKAVDLPNVSSVTE